MSKKQQRIDDMATLKNFVPDISGEKVNIVLKNNGVVFARIMALENDILIVKNMRAKKQKIALDSIEEIIIDQQV